MSVDLTGKKAPTFTLPDKDGKKHSLADFAGKNVVIYFYPKDDTPGCTREACGFRDARKDFEASDTVIIGISKDGAASHAKFIEKYGLPFLLLSDEGNKVAAKYGAFGEKKMYGITRTGLIRSTFLIGADGKVAKQWTNVKVDGHVEKVLAEAQALG